MKEDCFSRKMFIIVQPRDSANCDEIAKPHDLINHRPPLSCLCHHRHPQTRPYLPSLLQDCHPSSPCSPLSSDLLHRMCCCSSSSVHLLQPVVPSPLASEPGPEPSQTHALEARTGRNSRTNCLQASEIAECRLCGLGFGVTSNLDGDPQNLCNNLLFPLLRCCRATIVPTPEL